MADKTFYPQGAYVCRVIDQALGENQKGNLQFVLRVKVLGKPDPETPSNYIPVDQQLERTSFMVLNEKTFEFTLEALRSIGFDKTSLRYLDKNTPGFHDFTGQEIDMWCKHDTYEGDTNEKWRISTGGGGAIDIKPADASKVRQMDNLFAKQLKTGGAKASPKSNGSPAATHQTAAATAEITDDDVPF